MKITLAVITLVTAADVLWGATLGKSRAHHGANQTSRASARAHAGKRATPATCPTSGFHPPGSPSCVCNFAGACDPSTNAHTPAASADLANLVGIAPQHIDALALGTPNLGKVCEDGVVAALYDCNARTSLYAATVIEGPNANAKGTRKDCWKSTTDPKLITHTNLLGTHDDYQDSSKRIYCYQDTAGKEFEWDGVTSCSASSPGIKIHKGHLIAARYGHTHHNPDATFTYTNAVPQQGGFNSGKWRTHEATVTSMAATCEANAVKSSLHAKVYVVVGVIPSTFLGKPRFFGSAGFGEFQGASKLSSKPGDFRISFPEIMWTAACCVYSDGSVHDRLAFWRRNWPDRTDPVSTHSSALPMFMDMQTEIRSVWGKSLVIPTIFPGKPGCD